eukprot:10922.XXX_208276_209579_1 [CDS] Oithona nana genome sequencing.
MALRILRLLSIQQSSKLSTSSNLSNVKDWGTPLTAKKFNVKGFGGSVKVTSPIDVTVKPAGNYENPNLDRAVVKLYSKNGHSALVKSSDLEGRTQISAEQNGSTLQIKGQAGSQSNHDALVVEVPVVHGVYVEAEKEANVEVSDFIESEFCTISSDMGTVNANRIKTDAMTVGTNSGDIVCTGHMQGTIKLNSVSGNVISEQRFIGPSLDISTDTGDIRIASSYSEQSKFVTNRGKINLRNIHNESYIACYENGDVKIKGIDGSTNIFVKKGDLEIHVSQIKHESRILVEEGDVILKMIDTHPVKLSIDANQIILDTKFSKYGKLEQRQDQSSTCMHYSASIHPNVFSPALTVIAENGNVIVESQDWAASLGLKLANPKYTGDELKL